MTSGAGVAAELQKDSVNFDFSTSTNIRFSVYIVDRTKVSIIAIFLGNEPTAWTNYYFWANSTQPGTQLKNGWNEISIAKTKFSSGGSPSWSSAIKRIKFRATGVTGQSAFVTFDSLRKEYTSTPVVSLVFDDNVDDVFTTAYPLMAANDQKGTLYVVKDWVGDAGYMSAAQIQSLYAAGWTIGNHTASHTDLTSLDAAGITTQVSDCHDYLHSIGIAGIHHLAYPYGSVNTTVYNVVKGLTNTARTVLQPASGQAFIESFQDLPWYIKAFPVVNTTTVAALQTMIDYAIEECAFLVLLFHRIETPTSETYSWLSADFSTLSDYLKTKSDAGSLSVMTMNEYWATFGVTGEVMLSITGSGPRVDFT